jgi:hypothetical protein
MIQQDYSAFGVPLSRATYINSNSPNGNNIIKNLIIAVAAIGVVAFVIYIVKQTNNWKVEVKRGEKE